MWMYTCTLTGVNTVSVAPAVIVVTMATGHLNLFNCPIPSSVCVYVCLCVAALLSKLLLLQLIGTHQLMVCFHGLEYPVLCCVHENILISETRICQYPSFDKPGFATWRYKTAVARICLILVSGYHVPVRAAYFHPRLPSAYATDRGQRTCLFVVPLFFRC